MNIFKKITTGIKFNQEVKLERQYRLAQLKAKYSDIAMVRTQEEIETGNRLLTHIGYALIEDGYSTDKAANFIENSKIKFAWYEKNKGCLHIYLERPGIFIGVKGKCISCIQDYIGRYESKLGFKEIKLHEYNSDEVERNLRAFTYVYK